MYMLKNTKNSSKKILFTKKYVLILALLFMALAFIILELTSTINVFDKNGSNDSTTTSLDSNSKTASVDYGPTKPEDVVVSPEKGGIKSEEINADTGATNENINVSITRASSESVGIYIEKLISGTCEFTITQSGIVKIAKTASVIPVADYSSCEGFDIDPNILNSTPFTVKVTVKSNGRTGIAIQEVK